MNIDLRGFEYPLEPLRRQRRWQLDALLAKLGSTQREISLLEEQLQALQIRHARESQLASEAFAEVKDPHRHTHRLHWLARLRSTMLALGARVESLKGMRESLRKQCLTQHQKLEALEAHRQDALSEFARESASKLIREADRDWLCRPSRASMSRALVRHRVQAPSHPVQP